MAIDYVSPETHVLTPTEVRARSCFMEMVVLLHQASQGRRPPIARTVYLGIALALSIRPDVSEWLLLQVDPRNTQTPQRPLDTHPPTRACPERHSSPRDGLQTCALIESGTAYGPAEHISLRSFLESLIEDARNWKATTQLLPGPHESARDAGHGGRDCQSRLEH